MDILVVAPMIEERENFLKALKGMYYDRGIHNYYHVITSGIGKINAAVAVADWFGRNGDSPLDMIMLIGYAGGASGYVPGDIVIPNAVKQWDVDTPLEPLFQSLHKLIFLKGADAATILTGDSFVTRKIARQLERVYGNKAVYDMECAAVAEVAAREKVPLLAVKIISDVPYSGKVFCRRRKNADFKRFIASNKDFRLFIEIAEQF